MLMILEKVRRALIQEEMDSFSEDLYKSLIENMNLTVEVFIQNMEENKDGIEREISCTLKKLEF